jgi:hypothetical protein
MNIAEQTELLKRHVQRLEDLLHEWVAAAQSGGVYFGRVLQEPRPWRLREAITAALETRERWAKAEEEIRDLKSELEKARKTLEDCKKGITEELDRGYVLTMEPLAGVQWRKRWNNLLGKVEDALTNEVKE